MILGFTRHENKFGAKTGRFLAEDFFLSALHNYQCKPGPMSLAAKKKEPIKIVPVFCAGCVATVMLQERHEYYRNNLSIRRIY